MKQFYATIAGISLGIAMLPGFHGFIGVSLIAFLASLDCIINNK